MSEDLGFLRSPVNGLGIVRARTWLGNLRLWDIPRIERALVAVIDEIGHSPIPVLYVLLDERSRKKVYIGQTENAFQRLTKHINAPERKIRDWQRVLLFNDGRNASVSDLSDENVRLTLEKYLVDLFKLNRYRVVTAATRSPGLSSIQAARVERFKQEINILLANTGKISRFITGRQDEEIGLDEAEKILSQAHFRVDKWGRHYAVVNGKPVVIRPGSLKAKGWQVTFRGSKSLAYLKSGEGYLLMPRGKIILLPLSVVKAFVSSVDTDALGRDTVDIFIQFEDDKVFLRFKQNSIEVTSYQVQK